MVSLRPDWQQRLAELYSDEAVLERAEGRAEGLAVSPTAQGGRPRVVLPAKVAGAVLRDLAGHSYRYTARKHGLSYGWLREAHQDGRLEAMADGRYC